MPPLCYIFGYGSLISSKSRGRTCPSACGITENAPLPVRVRGLCRTWGFRVAGPRSYTAVAVHVDQDAYACGALFAMTCPADLARLDVREEGYRKIELAPAQISVWADDLGFAETSLSRWHVRPASPDSGLRKVPLDAPIYAYVADALEAPSLEHPLVQTYLDVCLTGCLEHHLNFAREFIATTWSHPRQLGRQPPSLPDAAHVSSQLAACPRLEAVYDHTWPWVDDRALQRPYRHVENKVMILDSGSAFGSLSDSVLAEEQRRLSAFELVDGLLEHVIPDALRHRRSAPDGSESPSSGP